MLLSGYSSIKMVEVVIMRRIIVFLLLLIMVLMLTACNRGTMHSIQYGKVDRNGNIVITKTIKSDPIFENSEKLLGSMRNIFLKKDQVNHLSTQYMQFRNERQNMVISNYYLWDDVENERFICRPYFDDAVLFYEITGHEYRMLKKEIDKIKASKEPLLDQNEKSKSPVEKKPIFSQD